MATGAPAASRGARDERFRAIFDEHVAYVTATLTRLGIRDEDRDDLASEVFVRVHRELDAYDTSRPIRPWLFAFAARVASEHRRRAHHRREVLTEPPDAASNAPTPDAALEQARARRTVQMALDTLDDDKRAVFVLHDLDEVPIPVVALALGIAEGTAYSRLRAARGEVTAFVRRLKLIGGPR